MQYYLVDSSIGKSWLIRKTDDLRFQYQDQKTGEWKGSPDAADAIMQGEARKIDLALASTYMVEDTTQSQFAKSLAEAIAKYDPDQPRDDQGQWTSMSWVDSKGNVQINHKAYQEKVKGQSDDALRYTIKDAGEAITANPTGKKAGYYADEIHYAAAELRNRAASSSSGSGTGGVRSNSYAQLGSEKVWVEAVTPQGMAWVRYGSGKPRGDGGSTPTPFKVDVNELRGPPGGPESGRWIARKEEDLETSCINIVKTDDERQLVYGEVYAPMVPDSHGDYMTAEQIEKAAHRFMANGPVGSIDMEHNLKDTGSVVVESFIARSNDPDFTPGAWVVAAHVVDPAVWKLVKGGEINGFSMYGSGIRTEREIEIELPDDGVVRGEVAKSGETKHSHTFVVKYNDKGEFLGGETSMDDGHKHLIRKGSITEEANGHTHRYSYTGVAVHEG